MNAIGHTNWRDVKTTDAFGDLTGSCHRYDDIAAVAFFNHIKLLRLLIKAVGVARMCLSSCEMG